MKRKRIFILACFLLVVLPGITTQATSAEEGHYHGDIRYEPWPGTNGALPRQGGYYYLTEDIVRSETASAVTIPAGVSVHLCLNGHTVTHRNLDERLYTVKGDFCLEDCCEKAGGIAYGGKYASTCSNGALVQVQRGGMMTMTGGQIYGLSSIQETGAAIYVQGATTTARAVFNLLGGQLSSNTAAICMTSAVSFPARENFSQVNICAGSIRENGSAIRVESDALRITGGRITENQGTGVCVGSGAKLALSGRPYITGNQTGNLYLEETVVMELGPLEPGAKVGVAAQSPCRVISTPLSDVPQDCFYSDDPCYQICVQAQCVFLDNAHRHPLTGEESVTWRKWTEKTRLPAVSGNYYLAQDVVLTEEAVAEEDVILKLCLNGYSITAAEGKRIMTVASGAQVNITDCREACGCLTGGSSARGGGFYVMRRGSLTFYNGTIAGNTATEAGGAVYLQSARADQPGGQLQILGGQISGGIYAEQDSLLLLAGGKVTGVTVEDRVQVQGSPVVEDLYLMGNACITATELNENAKLSVSVQYPDRPITDGPVTDVAAGCFISENRYRIIEHQEYIYLNTSREHSHCSCNGDRDGCDHDLVFWQAWESRTELPQTSGHYYLLEDVQLTDQMGIVGGQDVYLCLNGHTVTAAKEERLFQVHSGGRLTVTDCAGDGKLTGGNQEYGGAINIMRGAAARLYGGTMTGNRAQLGSAVYVQGERADMTGGAFYMYGGGISENTGYNGAVYMDSGSCLYICGGSVTGNWSENHGGGIYLAPNTRADISNVTLEGNRAGKRGGGIYQSGNTELTVTGCRFLQNVSADTGSALYLDGAFLLESCCITGNRAGKGTAVYVAPATGVDRKMGGDLWIWGNTGTMKADLYLGKGVTVTGTDAGFGRNTRIRVQIYSGFLTDVFLAAYDYEGGNRVYTVTYGNRSLTDPEKETAVEETALPETKPEKAAGKWEPEKGTVKPQPKPEETMPSMPAPLVEDGDLPLDVPTGKGRLGAGILLASIVFTMVLLHEKRGKKV